MRYRRFHRRLISGALSGHASRENLKEEYLEFLQANGVNYDEKYLW